MQINSCQGAGYQAQYFSPNVKKRGTIPRRHRRLVCLAIFLLSFVLVAALTPRASGSSQVQQVSITVRAGDTLWQLAQQYGPGQEDTRRNIYDILQLNGLSNSQIFPGQVLQLPAEW